MLIRGDVSTEGSTPARKGLPDDRKALTHKFSIAGHEGYITVAMYEDGRPGEIFLVLAREGTIISGLMDAFARAISLLLQYGVPLEVIVKEWEHVRFEPSGFTKNPQIPYAKSIVDYIVRWLALRYLPKPEEGSAHEGPPCPECGTRMEARENIFVCPNCGQKDEKGC